MGCAASHPSTVADRGADSGGLSAVKSSTTEPHPVSTNSEADTQLEQHLRAEEQKQLPLTRVALDLSAAFPASPIEFREVVLEPRPTPSSIEACLISPSARVLVLTRIPPFVHAKRPIEIELSAAGLGAGADTTVSLTSWISSCARLSIVVDVPGRPQEAVSLPLYARSYDGGWIARTLVRPACWAGAASVTLTSLTLAGWPLPCDCLPATLRVGYNHEPADAGAVLAAAKLGDVTALQAALDSGGSTEEADEDEHTPSYWAAYYGDLEALRILLAAGANPAAADNCGTTPLHGAVRCGRKAVVALLLATPGVDPLAVNEDGCSSLDLAQRYRKYSTAGLLLADPRVAEAEPRRIARYRGMRDSSVESCDM